MIVPSNMYDRPKFDGITEHLSVTSFEVESHMLGTTVL